MTNEEARARIRKLKDENDNLRRRCHRDAHDAHHRIRALEEQIRRDVWLPLYTMDTVRQVRDEL